MHQAVRNTRQLWGVSQDSSKNGQSSFCWELLREQLSSQASLWATALLFSYLWHRCTIVYHSILLQLEYPDTRTQQLDLS